MSGLLDLGDCRLQLIRYCFRISFQGVAASVPFAFACPLALAGVGGILPVGADDRGLPWFRSCTGDGEDDESPHDAGPRAMLLSGRLVQATRHLPGALSRGGVVRVFEPSLLHGQTVRYVSISATIQRVYALRHICWSPSTSTLEASSWPK